MKSEFGPFLRRLGVRALPRGAGRACRRVLHAGRVERRPPAALVIARELKIEALVRHADGDASNASPGVELRAESVEPAMLGRARKSGKADCCTEELAALVEHRLIR